MRRLSVLTAAGLLLLGHAPASAATDKEHRQMMADIRMLHEQTQQLQALIGNLTDTLKMVTAKLDDQANTSRKAFADQKLLVDNVADNVRVLREKVDDTNVRISSMTQEIAALKLSVTQMTTSPAPAGVSGEPGATPPPGAPPATTPGQPSPVGTPPDQLYNMAFSDFTAGQWDLAISGFQRYLREYPKLPMADDAQFNIGQAYYNDGKFKDAVDAYNRVISAFPGSDRVADAYYKRGVSYEHLNQMDLARQSYEYVIKTYPPEHATVLLASQALARLNQRIKKSH